jgi:beta-galactosidase
MYLIDFVLQDDKPWVVSLFGQVLIIWANLRLMMKVSHPGILFWNDLAGLPKDHFYLSQNRWNTERINPSYFATLEWEGREGQTTPVLYTSFNSAELL